jgi:hypothetical protein
MQRCALYVDRVKINSYFSYVYIDIKLSIIYPTIAKASRVEPVGVRIAVRPIH